MRSTTWSDFARSPASPWTDRQSGGFDERLGNGNALGMETLQMVTAPVIEDLPGTDVTTRCHIVGSVTDDDHLGTVEPETSGDARRDTRP